MIVTQPCSGNTQLIYDGTSQLLFFQFSQTSRTSENYINYNPYHLPKKNIKFDLNITIQYLSDALLKICHPYFTKVISFKYLMSRNNYLPFSMCMFYLHTCYEQNPWGNTVVSGFEIFSGNCKFLATSSKKRGVLQ